MTLDQNFENHIFDVLDAGHAIHPGADAPPADTWQCVLAQIQSQSQEKTTMNSMTRFAPIEPMREYEVPHHKGFAHYLNLAATIAIVTVVALGGWFVTMQMNAPGGNDGNLAMIGATPGTEYGAVCDVEPMTIDEVMAIVKNPFAGMNLREGVFTSDVLMIRDLSNRDLVEANSELVEAYPWRVSLNLLDRESSVPNSQEFDEATSVMNQFLGCLQVGTVAQSFRFFAPTEIQRIVLASYPVFRDEAQIREGLMSILDQPAWILSVPMSEVITETGLTFSANPDYRVAASIPFSQSEFDASRIFMIGIRVTNENGEVIFQNEASGRTDPIGPFKTTDRFRVVMVQSRYTGEWYAWATIPE